MPRGLRAPWVLPGESLPWQQAQTFILIFQAARAWGCIMSQASTRAGFSICHLMCPTHSPGDTPVAQPHLGAAEQLCKLGRPGTISPAPPDGPSRLHLEAIQKSLSPCLTTSLGNAASTTRPSAAAQPLIPAVSAARSLTYSHAGEATGKMAGGSVCRSMAAPSLPGALALSGRCGGKKDGSDLSRRWLALASICHGCGASRARSVLPPAPQEIHAPLNPELPTSRHTQRPAPGHFLTELKELCGQRAEREKEKEIIHFTLYPKEPRLPTS